MLELFGAYFSIDGVNVMKDLSLLDKILFALRYKDSIIHNIFLTIIFIVAGIFVLFLFACIKATETIVFKANNGLVYSLNMQNLGISEKKSIDVVKYFENNDKAFTYKNLGKGMSIIKSSEKDRFTMFLTDSDINNLKEGLEVSGSVKNTERRYLYSGSLDNAMGLKKLTPEVFLLGGFLFNQVSNDKYFYDNIGIDPQNKNFKNFVNLSDRGESKALEPFKVEDSNLSLIVHKKAWIPELTPF